MNRFLLVSMLFTIAACATPDAEPDRYDSAHPVAAGDAGLVRQSGPAQDADNAPQTAASAENQGDLENLEDIEAPDVRETPAAMIPRIQREPEVICEKVRPTGSIIPVEVCRRRADIEKQRQDDQEAFGKIKSNTANAASRL